jgi:hypothetical protein
MVCYHISLPWAIGTILISLPSHLMLYGSFGMEIPCEPLENRLSNMGKKKSPREMLTRVTNQRISLKGLILQERD